MSPTSPQPVWKIYAYAAVIALAVAIAYANSVRIPFVFDDADSVTANPSIRELARAGAVLTPDSGTTAGRPLLNLSFALNYAAGGEAVTGYHLANVALHVCAAWVLFGLLRRSMCRIHGGPGEDAATGLAAVAALLWAVHPLLTNAVSYVSQRSEVAAGLCTLLVLYGLVRSAGSPRSAWWLGASVAAELCGLGFKEVLVTVPLVACLYDRWFLAGSFRAALKQRPAYYAALASGWLLLAFLMIRFPIAGRGVGPGVPLTTNLATEANAIAGYLRRTLWPSSLVFDYGPNAFMAPGWSTAFPLLIVLTLGGCALLAWRRASPLAFLPAAFLLLLAPTSSFVPILLQPIAESRMYLPSALVAIAGVLASARFCGGALGRGMTAALVMAAATAMVAGTWARNADYRTPVRLWSDTVAKVPTNPRAYNFLGTALIADGRPQDAERAFRSALAVDPSYAPAHFNLGVTLLNAHRAAEALPHLEPATSVPHDRPRLLLYLGQAYGEVGQPERAVPALREAMKISPGDVEPAFALGNALAALGRYAEAADAFRAAANAAPAQTRVRNNLANALLYAGRIDDAIVEYQAALATAPLDADIRANLEQALRYRVRQRTGGRAP